MDDSSDTLSTIGDFSSVTEVIMDISESFSIDETRKFIIRLAAGKSADQAKTMITTLEKRLQSAEEPKEEITEDDLHGRSVLEMAQNQITKVGKVMIAVVNSGINLPAFSNEIITSVGFDENEIRNLKTIKEQIFPQPDIQIYKMKAQILVDEFAYNAANVHSEDEVKEFKITTENQFNKEFMKAYEKWEANIEIQNNSKKALFELANKKEQLVVIEIVIQALISSAVVIVSKIKRAVKNYPKIVKKLKGAIIVGEKRITDPYSSDNLSGIYAKLRDEYGSNSIVSFSTSLVSMLSKKTSFEDIKCDPMTPIIYAEAYMKEWEQRDLFKMMTPDMFFSAIVMNMIPPKSELYKNVTTEFLKHQKELVKNPSNDEYENFNFIRTYIKDVYGPSKELIESSADSKQYTSKSSGNNSGAQRTKYISSNSSGLRLESAAAAQDNERKNLSYKFISQGENIGKEITRGDMRGIIIKDKKYPYTATKIACPKCTAISGAHSPKCWISQCNKCKLFGHKSENCVQVLREAAKVATTTNSGVQQTGFTEDDEEIHEFTDEDEEIQE